MRVAVYAIAKNEAAHIRRCLDSAREADLFVLCDTGSTDETDTVLAVRQLAPTNLVVHRLTIAPWRFDDARNAALALVPADVDVCVSLDLDEVLQPGWRTSIEAAFIRPGPTRFRYLFDWGDGIRFKSDKVHVRRGYRWKGACHERLVPDRIHEVFVETDELLVVHLPDPAKSRASYLELLEVATREDPTDARAAFYFARELSYRRRWSECAAELARYLALPSATWKAERAYAMRLLGDAHEALGDLDAAHFHYAAGAREAPERRESFVALASYYYRRNSWSECLDAALQALDTPEVFRTQWPTDPDAWTWKAPDLAAIAAYNLGQYDLAVKYGNNALGSVPATHPQSERMERNLMFYDAMFRGKDTAIATLPTMESLSSNDEVSP